MRADATKATGILAHVEGNGGTASGNYSHAEGDTGIASAAFTHVEGTGCTASSSGAHAEGNSTTASGSQSHAEGYITTAGGASSHAEGQTTSASGNSSHAEGINTTASGTYSHAEGDSCIAGGSTSHAQGAYASAPRYLQSSQGAGQFATTGDAQAATFVASRQTTDATATVLTFNQSGAITLTGANTNVLTIPINRAHQFTVNVVARRSDVSGDTAGWEFRGLVSRGSSGNAALVGTTLGSSWGAAGAAAWDVTLSVNTTDATNNYLVITVTGEAAKTIRWVARIDTVEVG